MKSLIAYIVVSILALGTIGCSNDNRQQKGIVASKVAVPSVVGQPKPTPAALPVSAVPAGLPEEPVSATPAKSKPKRPPYKVRHAVASMPIVQCAPEKSRACDLAMEILNVPPAERFAWAKQEFAKREIADVRDDQ